jgi:hypothetical protein
VLTLSESFDDEEGEEDAIQSLEAGEDMTVAFEPSEESFDLVPFAIERPVIAPGIACWEANKQKDISTLRNDWAAGKRPLTRSLFGWH